MAYIVRYKYTLYGEMINYAPTEELAIQNLEKAYKVELIGMGEFIERGDPDLEFECISIREDKEESESHELKRWVEEDDDFLTRKEKK